LKRNPDLPGIEIVIEREFSPVELPELVSSADIVVDAYVTKAESRLSDDGRQVFTDTSIQVLQVAKGPHQYVGQTLTVRKPGGTVVIDGKQVLAHMRRDEAPHQTRRVARLHGNPFFDRSPRV
jgi:hypothetical protein